VRAFNFYLLSREQLFFKLARAWPLGQTRTRRARLTRTPRKLQLAQVKVDLGEDKRGLLLTMGNLLLLVVYDDQILLLGQDVDSHDDKDCAAEKRTELYPGVEGRLVEYDQAREQHVH